MICILICRKNLETQIVDIKNKLDYIQKPTSNTPKDTISKYLLTIDIA